MHKFLKVFGPIILSALSIFISILILQPIVCWLDPTFSLLANRGVGKIGITILVIWQILLLLLTHPRLTLRNFLQTNLLFFKSNNWIKPFFKFFAISATLHAIFLMMLTFTGCVNVVTIFIKFNSSLGLKILLGFVATFFLAWTEELIFRGTVYKIFETEFCPLVSSIYASIIFMFAHNLTNPLALVSNEWKLGVGLFLLGLLLNITFIITNKLYTNMGIHAGLVFVKVFLRKVPFLEFALPSALPFFINKDLRQSLLVHLIFVIINMILIFKFKNRLLSSTKRTDLSSHTK